MKREREIKIFPFPGKSMGSDALTSGPNSAAQGGGSTYISSRDREIDRLTIR